jgi:hypothetical protein
MTFDGIDARRHATVMLAADAEEWDDPETDDADADSDDDELGYRDADEEDTYDESAGDQGEDG